MDVSWEIAAIFTEEPEPTWRWTWRRVADDSGRVIEESAPFEEFDDCIEDAQVHGLDFADCVLNGC